MSEFVSVPAIVVVCYLIGLCVKTFFGDKADKFIPCICGICGAILGIVVSSCLWISSRMKSRTLLSTHPKHRNGSKASASARSSSSLRKSSTSLSDNEEVSCIGIVADRHCSLRPGSHTA